MNMFKTDKFKKLKIKINKQILRKKLRRFVRGTVFKSVVASIVTFVVMMSVVVLVLAHYKDKFINIVASQYLENKTQVLDNKNTTISIDKLDSKSLANMNPEVQKDPETVVNAVKKANPAVVSIIITKEVPKYMVSYKDVPGTIFKTPVYTPNGTEQKKLGGGSGFLISPSGMIVTNRHVVLATDVAYNVYLSDGRKYTAQVLARDPVLDVAILQISGSNLPYLQLGDSDTIEVGQSVVAIGNALSELKNTVSVGVISGLSRSVRAGGDNGFSEKLDKVIQTDAAINPGNSGGPLLNLAGQVVGINVAVAQGSENIGFALPINSVKGVISSVKKTGKIARPFVGMRYVTIDADIQAEKNLPVDYGVLIVKGKDDTEPAVLPGSPAQNAGLKEGDIVLEVDGQRIDSEAEFASIIRPKKIGSIMSLKIISGGITKNTYLVIGQAPDNL
jgi:serine protease Do